MTSIKLLAPAKVNLFLEVLNKRKDGYHNILTLFERISLADEIIISKIPEGIIVSSDKFITASPMDNLVYKASKLIMRAKKVKSGVRIRIKKRIPIAAGLGGGSSDAASVLLGINKLFGLKVKEAALLRMGEKLGADVPFFLLNTPLAIGKSKGEKLERINLPKSLWHIVICPGFKVPTKDVYEAFDGNSNHLTGRSTDDKIQYLLRKSISFDAVEPMLYNDLEETVVSKKKVIGNIIGRLAAYLGKKAILSGSGPSVFCLYKTRKEAIEARGKLLRSIPAERRKSWQVFVAGTKF